MSIAAPADCPLCRPAAETVLWQDRSCRVIRVTDEPDYPAWCRVVWHAHVAEMTDLPAADQRHLFNVVMAVEAALRECVQPDKINVAALGNVVPHLHWHLIPRFGDDRHFPNPVWGAARRGDGEARIEAVDDAALAVAVRNAIAERIAG